MLRLKQRMERASTDQMIFSRVMSPLHKKQVRMRKTPSSIYELAFTIYKDFLAMKTKNMSIYHRI